MISFKTTLHLICYKKRTWYFLNRIVIKDTKSTIERETTTVIEWP